MDRILGWWTCHSHKLWFVVIGILAVSSLNRLIQEFGRLIWNQGRTGAIDLKIFYEAVQLWFLGAPTYGELPSAVYPPASYLMLWPVLGWLTIPPARILWALISALALVWLMYLVVKESKADAWHEKVLIAFLPIFYATRTGIGNGQLTIVVVPLLISGVLLFRRHIRLGEHLWATAMIVGALIKPNISAPFFWLVLFTSGGQSSWPALMVILDYGGLTLWASAFQDESAITLMRQWFSQAEVGAEFGAQAGGYANQNSLLAWLEANTNINNFPLFNFVGDFELNTPLTLGILVALGLWICWHRNIEIWVLLGVCAVVARLWTYHRIYDDMLILLPTIAVFQIYKQLHPLRLKSQTPGVFSSQKNNTAPFLLRSLQINHIAYLILGIAYLAAVMPANLLEIKGPISIMFQTFQMFTWLALLGFLVYWAWGNRRSAKPKG